MYTAEPPPCPHGIPETDYGGKVVTCGHNKRCGSGYKCSAPYGAKGVCCGQYIHHA